MDASVPTPGCYCARCARARFEAGQRVEGTDRLLWIEHPTVDEVQGRLSGVTDLMRGAAPGLTATIPADCLHRRTEANSARERCIDCGAVRYHGTIVLPGESREWHWPESKPPRTEPVSDIERRVTEHNRVLTERRRCATPDVGIFGDVDPTRTPHGPVPNLIAGMLTDSERKYLSGDQWPRPTVVHPERLAEEERKNEQASRGLAFIKGRQFGTTARTFGLDPFTLEPVGLSPAVREILEDANVAVRNVCFGHISADYFDGDNWTQYPGGVVPLAERRARYENLRTELIRDIRREAPQLSADDICRHLDAVWDATREALELGPPDTFTGDVSRYGRAFIAREPDGTLRHIPYRDVFLEREPGELTADSINHVVGGERTVTIRQEPFTRDRPVATEGMRENIERRIVERLRADPSDAPADRPDAGAESGPGEVDPKS